MGVYGVSTDATFTSSAVFRDPAAWYHVVLVFDTTQATDTNRMKLYVNGIQQTFSSAQYPSQNYSTPFNNNVLHRIANSPSSEYYDGYMTNINMVDGQALSPYAFGNFNSYGVWAPVAYSGVYGTNGYYLPFTQSTSTTYTGLFNGSSYWASVADNAAFTLGTNDFTVEAWINSSTYGGDNQFIIDQWNSSSYGWAFSVNSATNIRFEYFTGGSYVNRNYTCPTLQPNVWYHIAWVRSSGTTTVYINGTAIGTSSDNVSIDNSSYQVAIGRNNDGGGSYVKNYLSNLRFVNGSAVYTSNFTPPTSPLTAVTNTQLLTLQSSTLVDNSPNAFSISNNGILMAVANPFTVGYNISADYSPQGNNWTPNNISLAPGSTYDSMVDVPTLTSANVANYCVLNPLWKDSSLTISNGNLNVVAGGSVAGGLVGGTIAVNSGKWYWETTCVAGDNYWAGAIISTSLYAPSFGNLSAGLNYGYNNGGYKYNGQTQTSYGASYTTGDVIGTAFDADAGTITFYKNNVSQGTAFTGITGTYSPAILANYTGSGGASQLNANFGQQPFKYTPPSGYLPLNTFNM
jgi:hypothetical protein